MNTANPTNQEHQSPPSERLGGDQGKQSQVPSDLQNSPAGAAGKPFAPDIEAEWLRYLGYQSDRLKAAGEEHPYVALYSHGAACAGDQYDRRNTMARANTLDDAVSQRIAFLTSVEERKAAKIADLEAELAELKGEGAKS